MIADPGVFSADLGTFCLLAAMVFAVFAIFASLYGDRRQDSRILEAGQRSTGVVFALVTVAVGCVWYLLLNSDFRFEYIASHSNAELPLAFKIGALWSGQQGSLLLWTWVLTGFSALSIFLQRKNHNRLVPYAIVVMMGTATFFLYLNNFKTNPFDHLVQVHASGQEHLWAPADGRGLNPLLQHWAMVIHPPILYIGYIGFVVPFAFAIAALWTRQLGTAWVLTVRRWTLVSWAFLGAGILLGAKWAYVELGWGGYWAWDPVENASLMPWLTGTAFLHSVIVQEKRGMLKVWNVSLICLTYLLAILGTFLTRSGVVTSVHSFAKSDIGGPFAAFLVAALVLCAVLILKRLPYLRSENKMDSMLSRESGFLFNNLLLLAAAFSVLFGTVFPIFSELATGNNVSVGQAYFNKVEIPLGLILLFLVGVGPLLSYRKTSKASLRKNFLVPVVLGVISAPVLFMLGVRSFWPLLSLTLCVFVTLTILQEFHKGAVARVRQHGENYVAAIVNLLRRNNRRYGGYVVHFGIVLIFLGITGAAFVREGRGIVAEGDEFTVQDYTFKVNELTERDLPNYYSWRASIDVYKGGQRIETLRPEKRVYHASQQPSSEVAIAQGPQTDLYLVYAGLNEDRTKAVMQVYLNPLVMWVWIGGLVMVLGTLVCLLPSVRRKST
jgi:cytochrome c-type biogenesis protein CcmF